MALKQYTTGLGLDQVGNADVSSRAKDDSYMSNVASVEKAESDRLKQDLWRKGRRVTKVDFANYMRVARGGKEVDKRAVDLFFDVLDSDKGLVPVYLASICTSPHPNFPLDRWILVYD
jgi:hypothetical protein